VCGVGNGSLFSILEYDMRCRACDSSIEGRPRMVTDENKFTHVLIDDLCGYCIVQSKLKYSDDDLRDVYTGVQYANFKVIR
jgi:hypothetical protein